MIQVVADVISVRNKIDLESAQDDFIKYELYYESGKLSQGRKTETLYTVYQRQRVTVSEEISVFEYNTMDKMKEIAMEKLSQKGRVWVSASNTINLKDFNSAKLDAGMSIDVEENETPEMAFDRCWKTVTSQVREARQAVLAKVLAPLKKE